ANAGENGSHRESARDPKAIEPGKPFPLAIQLHFTSWVFPKGHRVRLAVSNAQWAVIWPAAFPTTTSLFMGGADGSRLLLPVVPPGGAERPKPDFRPISPPEPALAGFASIDTETPSGYGEISSIDRNPRTGHSRVSATNASAHRYP